MARWISLAFKVGWSGGLFAFGLGSVDLGVSGLGAALGGSAGRLGAGLGGSSVGFGRGLVLGEGFC